MNKFCLAFCCFTNSTNVEQLTLFDVVSFPFPSPTAKIAVAPDVVSVGLLVGATVGVIVVNRAVSAAGIVGLLVGATVGVFVVKRAVSAAGIVGFSVGGILSTGAILIVGADIVGFSVLASSGVSDGLDGTDETVGVRVPKPNGLVGPNTLSWFKEGCK